MMFSAGPRCCIGKTLAMTEIKVMVIKLMLRYEKVAEQGIKERAYDIPLTHHIRNPQAYLHPRKLWCSQACIIVIIKISFIIFNNF